VARAGRVPSPPMPEVQRLERFAPADVRAVRELADAVEEASGVAPFGEVTWDGLAGRGLLGDSGLIVRGSSEDARAYAHVAHHQPEEWIVELAAAPEAAGVEPLLLARAIAVVADAGGGHVTLWLHGPGGEDLARDGGFVLERELLELRVPLPLADAPRWPPGVTVRTFVVGRDDEAWLGVNNRAFAGHPEQGGWTLATLRQRQSSDWFDPDGFLLAFGDAVAPGRHQRGSVVDVTPTVLYFLGLAVGRDMDGYARTDLFTRAFTDERPIAFIPTYNR